MTYDPDQRLLFSPRIMPFLCLYPRVLSFPGWLSFLLNSSSWISCVSKDTTTLSTADKKRERKVNPPTDWVYHPPSSPFVLCLLYTIPPIHQAYQPLYPIDFNPIHPSPCSTSRTGQKAKKASEKVPYHVSICIYPAHTQSTYDHHMKMSIITSTLHLHYIYI